MTTAVFDSTGPLKRVLLAKPTFHEVLPVGDFSIQLIDDGIRVDHSRGIETHSELESALTEAGVQIQYLPVTPDLPYQVFTRDFGINTPHGVLLGKFRHVERKAEVEWARRGLEALGETLLDQRITKGVLEGGDCFWLDATNLIVGLGERSSMAGHRSAQEILFPLGVKVVAIEFLSKWNHLDMIFQPLADKLAIACREALSDYLVGYLHALGWELIWVPEAHFTRAELSVLSLGSDRVLSFKGNRLNSLFRAQGLRVYDPAFDVFCAQGAGPHCATLELERSRSYVS